MIKAIIFDCFGVLYVHHGPSFIKNHIQDYPAHQNELYDLVKQANYGLISQNDFASAISKLTKLDESYVNQQLGKGFARNERLIDYIQTNLKPKYKVAMLSNISAGSMHHYFSEAEAAQLFDAVGLSSEMGIIKPRPRAYEIMCKRLGVDVSEAVMVDDTPENVKGAIAAGMHAIEFDGLAHLQRSLKPLVF